MRDQGQEGLLITGRFGTGKSTVLEEIAAVLEDRGAPFAAIDLDWLAWFDVPGGAAEHEMLVRNLASVVGNYLAEGVRWFVFARALRDRAEPESLRSILPFPLHVVGLTVPRTEVERRLGSDPTTGSPGSPGVGHVAGRRTGGRRRVERRPGPPGGGGRPGQDRLDVPGLAGRSAGRPGTSSGVALVFPVRRCRLG